MFRKVCIPEDTVRFRRTQDPGDLILQTRGEKDEEKGVVTYDDAVEQHKKREE